MNVLQTKRTLRNIPWKRAVLLLGGHGKGKSEVVFQVAAEKSRLLKKSFQVIDFRLAQCEVGDLIGMMKSAENGEVRRQVFNDGVLTEEKVLAHGNITIHDLAEWFPTEPDSCGFLFLDELFRAPRDLQNAVMELSLDYRYHFKSLPQGWRVISASNDDMDKYSGTFPDPALFDRFLKIKFDPSIPEWVEYAESVDVHKAILQYVSKFHTDLDTPEQIELGKIYPSRRAWVHFSEWIKEFANNGDDLLGDLDYLTKLAIGYVGESVAINFVEYVRKNYKVHSAEDILNKMTKEMEDEFKASLVTDVTFYSKEIVNYIKKEKVKLSKKQGDNLAKFFKAIPKEAAAGFWSLFTSECREEATRWYKADSTVQAHTMGLIFKAEAMKA